MLSPAGRGVWGQLGGWAHALLPGQDRRRAQARARFLAQHDLLTGALNAEPFSRELQHRCNEAQRDPPRALAVLRVDLDGFGAFTARHGATAGDELLRRTAERLQRLLRNDDRLARLGGDQFAVLQRDGADTAGVTALVQRINAALAEPHTLPGLPEPVLATGRIGVALFGPDGADAGPLLHHAEQALLRAKAQGGAWSFHDPALDHRLQDRRALAQDLRHALAQGFLRLHYQPVLAADGTLAGYEALARWPHPTRGFVPPAEFIPVAETSGQIERLGRWVLHASCAEAASWPAPLHLAVNLSAVQFRQGQRLVDEVRSALQASGLAPERLELEITERLMLQPSVPVLETLQALQRLGVRLVLDDFGSGQASLACLWQLPVHKLKIDPDLTRSVGHDIRADAVVRSIVQMAGPLKIRVAAEGVETEDQWLALCGQGCDEGQGHFLGRPSPAERLVHLESEIVAVVESASR